MQESTGAIIQRVLSGEIDAYALIVRRYQNEVWRIAAWALHDVSTTEDLVQQAFVNAYTNLDKFQPERDFGAWLRTIARNLVRNELRRAGRETHRLRHYHQWLEQRIENREECDRLDEELRRHLETCRKQLSESAAEAVRMRYDRAMGFSEMAGVLGRTVEATRQMLARIRTALRRCMEERRSQA
jgi:RNA polymerase sigma-70 factor, ECF subfamily